MTAAAQQSPKQAGPLDRLADVLRDDMKRVNETIVDRMKSEVALIPKLAGYLIAAGGKRIRPLLTLASAQMYGYRGPAVYGLAAAVEFIHTATLLHDDVVDESAQRRGKESANIVFGNQASVLVGDFLFSRAFQLMTESGSLDALRILSDASAVIAEGEVLQLAAVSNIDTTMNDYGRIISAKTAALFAAACEIGPVIAGAGKDSAAALCEYGMNLGIAFQIADDVLDYDADEKQLGKTVGDDFREGKMTAPVILALEGATDEERSFWTRTMADKKQQDGDLARAQDIIRNHNAIRRSLILAEEYVKKARLALAEAPDGPLRSLLDELAAYTVSRSS
jgi:octaprenyl-diphosphate synthase